MAANVVTIRDEQEWKIIGDFLSELEEGGIVVPPHVAKALDQKLGTDWEHRIDCKYMEYDYGGDPDILIDLLHDIELGQMGAEAIIQNFEENARIN
jgi:hypothetical protein